MARISIYVPDDLKERMEAAREEVNWSDVVRPALTAAVAAFEHRKEGSMQTAVERLRASRKQTAQDDKTNGASSGRAWAETHAEYRELKELHSLRTEHPEMKRIDSLEAAIDPNHTMRPQDIYERCHEVLEPPSEEFMDAFVDAAVKFFEEIRSEVERD